MSRIGNKSIEIPAGVKVEFDGGILKVSGPKGELNQDVRSGIDFEIEEAKVLVKRQSDSKQARAFHGLYRSLLNNMITGVHKGYERKLQLNGVGYRAQLKGSDTLNLSVGFSHPVDFPIPKGISCKVEENATLVILEGHDKQLIGQVAANIRKIRPPEPYKKKGIKYLEEHIRGKAGKSAK